MAGAGVAFAAYELHMRVVEARGLKVVSSLMDPYVIVRVGTLEKSCPPATDQHTTPTWNFKTMMEGSVADTVSINVVNKGGMMSSDKFIGSCSMAFASLLHGRVEDVWLPINNQGEETGQVRVRFQLMYPGERPIESADSKPAAAPVPAPAPAPVPAPAPAPAAGPSQAELAALGRSMLAAGMASQPGPGYGAASPPGTMAPAYAASTGYPSGPGGGSYQGYPQGGPPPGYGAPPAGYGGPGGYPAPGYGGPPPSGYPAYPGMAPPPGAYGGGFVPPAGYAPPAGYGPPGGFTPGVPPPFGYTPGMPTPYQPGPYPGYGGPRPYNPY